MTEFEEKRLQILEEAGKIFEKYGFKKTSMVDIAKAVNMGKASLYYYFQSKEDISLELMKMERETAFKRFHQIVDREISFAEKFQIMLESHFMIILENSTILLEMWQGSGSKHQKHLSKFFEESKNMLTQLYRDFLQKAKDQGIVRDSLDLDKFCRMLVDMILFGEDDFAINLNEHVMQKLKTYYTAIIDVFLHGILVQVPGVRCQVPVGEDNREVSGEQSIKEVKTMKEI